MLDAAAKVPLIIKYPGKAPEHRSEVCSLVDLMPTILGYAGVETEQKMDGIDLFNNDGSREFVFSQYANGTTGLYMVASDHDKLIYSEVDKKYWYFDEFPEHINRYDENCPRCIQMKQLMDAYIAEDCAIDPDDRVIDMEQFMKDYRYKLVKQDSVNRKDDEQNLMPPGYEIDCEIVYTWKRPKKN